MMVNSLQKQLTRSHFLVTLASVLLLALLVLTGYYIYLKTPYPARWAGLNAGDYAAELAYLAELWDEPLDETLAQDYLREITDAAFYDTTPDSIAENGDLFATAEDALGWLILSPNGHILATDDQTAYPVGQHVSVTRPPALQLRWLNTASVDAAVLETRNHYGQQDGFHVGFAPVVDGQGEVLGWLYYRAYDQPAAALLSQTALQLTSMLLGAALVAVIVAGLIGRRVAQHFVQRLHRVTAASVALAAGDIDQRVPIDGDDEIAQLGVQFNQMADQLVVQMRDLRQLADANAQLAQEARSLAALAERNRLARDLHDAIKQKLFGLNLTAGALKSMVQTDPTQAAQRLEQLSHITSEVLEEMDQIIKELRPAALEDQGLVSALTELIKRWQEQSGIPVDFERYGARELPLSVEYVLYRISQEALTNILKHAAAQQVNLDLLYGVDDVRLTIGDDGQGFRVDAPRSSAALGLDSMASRVAELGGTFRVESALGAGTQLDIKIPNIALEALDD